MARAVLRPGWWAGVSLSLFLGCGGGEANAPRAYAWRLPAGFPEPRVPDDNPMNDAKVELGRRLFYDVRLSGNRTQSCASCHVQARAFTDGRPVSEGSTGEHTPRGAMSLANAAYAGSLTWVNPTLRTLEAQALVPIFAEDPVELGLAGLEDVLLARLEADAEYPGLFVEAFGGGAPAFSVDRVAKALGAFQRTLVSGNSPYDRYVQGDVDRLSASARRGLELFFSERLECFHCHGGFNFSQSIDHSGNVFDQATFLNNGLYNVDGRGAYPAGNTGLFAFTADRADMGRFKPPTLRNIAVTAPYMHDGSIATLDEVLDHYARGGRRIDSGPHAGDGRENPNKSLFISGFTLNPVERADVLNFLRALTDRSFLEDARFSDPFSR